MKSIEELYHVVVNGFVGSWSSGINAYVDERKPISYGTQCIIKSLNDDSIDIVQVNVYHSKKGVRIVIQGKDSELLSLTQRAIPSGFITEDVLFNHKPIFI
jgi:hypothetical protein